MSLVEGMGVEHVCVSGAYCVPDTGHSSYCEKESMISVLWIKTRSLEGLKKDTVVAYLAKCPSEL